MKKSRKALFGAIAICAAASFVSCYTGSDYEEPAAESSGGNTSGSSSETSGGNSGTNTSPVSFKKITMKKIAAGSFKFGNETKNITAFQMSETEITQKLYKEIMGSHTNSTEGDKLPADKVSFYAALMFCNKLSAAEGLTPVYKKGDSTDASTWREIPTEDNSEWNAITEVSGANGFRLPHEAEWMLAALGNNASSFSGFDERYFSGYHDDDLTEVGKYAWFTTTKEGGEEEKGNANKTTHEVAKKTANSNGVYDMTGNVWEICWEKKGDKRLRKGGGNDQEYLGHYSVSTRWDIENHQGYADTGFRFKSEDGFSWSFWTVLAENKSRLGKMWECPDFFPLGDKYALLLSPQDMICEGEFSSGNGTACIIGDFDEKTGKFSEISSQCIDFGIDFYAPQTTLSPDGRRIMIGWLQNWDSCAIREEGSLWAGQMSIPREIFIKDGRLWQKPILEFESAKKVCAQFKNVELGENRISLDGVQGRILDLNIEIRPKSSGYSWSMRFAENGSLYTEIVYRVRERTLTVDRSQSGSRRAVSHIRECKILGDSETLSLEIVLDKNSAEIFINGGKQTMSTAIYTAQDAAGISFRADGEAQMDITASKIF